MAKAATKTRRRRITFSFEDAGAGEVILMGDFNNWDPAKHPMKHDGNGRWTKTVMLPAGQHEYKFLVDGRWKEDPRNGHKCPNCFGTSNSILKIGQS